MAFLRNNFEGGTNGVSLTTGNTGGASGDAASSITGTLTFDNSVTLEGGLACASPASSVAQQFKWSSLSLSSFKTRFLISYPTLQSADHWIFAASVAGTKAITLGVSPGNKFRLYTAAGTGSTIWTMTGTITAGWVYRVEVYANGLSASTADVKVALFGGSSVQTALTSTTPLESYDGTGVSNTGLSAFDNVVYGKYNGVTLANTHYIDALALDTTPGSDYPWPIYTRQIPTPVPSRAVARAANY